ncbi:MAG: hypothetical protein ACR2GX_08285 [Candidatus Dormibacteria bacterium]
MRCQDILEWSARLAGCREVPADSQVYVESTADLRRVLFGVDIEIGEILWAQREGFDAVIAHHPLGDRARLDFASVVARQVEQMCGEGIAEAVAQAALEKRLERIHRATHMSNVNHLVDTARLVGMPLCNVHLACDIIGRQTIIDLLQRRASDATTVGDVISWLGEIPEIAAAPLPPEAWLGRWGNRLGRWTVAMAGGTNGGHPVFREYYRVGVDSILAMHIAEDDLARLGDEVKDGQNLIITGHMGTDSIGINRVVEGLEEQGIKVVRTSGIVGGAAGALPR